MTSKGTGTGTEIVTVTARLTGTGIVTVTARITGTGTGSGTETVTTTGSLVLENNTCNKKNKNVLYLLNRHELILKAKIKKLRP